MFHFWFLTALPSFHERAQRQLSFVFTWRSWSTAVGQELFPVHTWWTWPTRSADQLTLDYETTRTIQRERQIGLSTGKTSSVDSSLALGGNLLSREGKSQRGHRMFMNLELKSAHDSSMDNRMWMKHLSSRKQLSFPFPLHSCFRAVFISDASWDLEADRAGQARLKRKEEPRALTYSTSTSSSYKRIPDQMDIHDRTAKKKSQIIMKEMLRRYKNMSKGSNFQD